MDLLLNTVLRGLITYNIGIFIALSIGLLIYLWKFWMGLSEWQKSIFGLEKEFAQRKLVSATTGLTLLLLLLLGEFILVTVISPRLPDHTADETPDITLTPVVTDTLSMAESQDESAEVLNPNGSALTPEPLANLVQESLVSECVEDVLEITYPGDGESISGTIQIIGSVMIENFGSYKYEYSTTGPINWITIAADNDLKLNESLGNWFTSSLTPGTYLLRLVPLNNVGDELTPCIITVDVVLEE